MANDTKKLQKSFALACRFISDNLDCPKSYTNMDFRGCNREPNECGHISRRWDCWQRYFRQRVENEQVCCVCGCTEDNACSDGCWWVKDDLCSACNDKKRP